jgi:hypothetical protein
VLLVGGRLDLLHAAVPAGDLVEPGCERGWFLAACDVCSAQ